jgi:hypothetical protein
MRHPGQFGQAVPLIPSPDKDSSHPRSLTAGHLNLWSILLSPEDLTGRSSRLFLGFVDRKERSSAAQLNATDAATVFRHEIFVRLSVS